jgi:hypothetical protein
MMSAISTSSQQQLSGIDQVSGAVTQMDHVVQQNAALVAQSAAAAENLADLAGQLMDSVARFRLDHDVETDAGRLTHALLENARNPNSRSRKELIA